MNACLNENEIKKAKECLFNIEDKLQAIEMELCKENPYKYYLLEKIDSVLWDSRCIANLCKTDEK